MLSVFGRDPADLLEGIFGNVDAGPGSFSKDLTAGGTYPIQGQNLKLEGALTATLTIYVVEQQVEVDETHTAYMPPAGSAFTEVKLTGTAQASSAGTVPLGQVSLSFSAGAGRSFTYRHLLAAEGSTSRINALSALLLSSNLPQLVALNDLKPNELQSLVSSYNLDLGLSAGFNFAGALNAQLFGNNKLPVTSAFQGGLTASLGFGLQDQFEFALDRINITQPNWVRVRLRRVHEDKLSLGAKFTLQIQYDMGSGLIGMMDDVLNSAPVVELKETLDKVNQSLTPIAEGDWEGILKNLSDDASKELYQLVEGEVDDLLGILNNPQVQKELNEMISFLGKYRSLDGKIQSLWDRTLDKLNLGPDSKFMVNLTKIANIDPQKPDEVLSSLLDGDATEAVELLECLSGKSLEELILSATDELIPLLVKIQGIAADALKVIQDTPGEVFAKLQAFAQKTGIETTATWLENNLPADGKVATLQANLKTKANIFIQKNVAKLLQKGFDAINPEDLTALQDFAKRVIGFSDDLDKGEAWLKQQFLKLKGEVGVNMGIEWERITQRTRVVDFEFDPTVPSLQNSYDLLRQGNIKGFLNSLPDDKDENPETDVQENRPFLLRECLLTNKHVRTGAFSLAISVLGLSNKSYSLEEESSVRVSKANSAWKREGHYAATYTRAYSDGASNWAASVIVNGKGESADKDLDSAYTKFNWGMELITSRTDSVINTQMLSSTLGLLKKLGFDGIGKIGAVALPGDATSSLAIKIALDGDVLPVLLASLDRNTWDSIYLKAASAWYDTELVRRLDSPYDGPALAEIVASQGYRDVFHESTNALTDETFQQKVFPIGTSSIAVADYSGLRELAFYSKYAPGRFGAMGQTLAKTSSCLGADIEGFLPVFTSGFKRAALFSWPSPMFGIYLVLSAIAQQDSSLLATARGIATFRWKPKGGEWQSPADMLLKGLTFV